MLHLGKTTHSSGCIGAEQAMLFMPQWVFGLVANSMMRAPFQYCSGLQLV